MELFKILTQIEGNISVFISIMLAAEPYVEFQCVVSSFFFDLFAHDISSMSKISEINDGPRSVEAEYGAGIG